jgi:hypothetical protein
MDSLTFFLKDVLDFFGQDYPRRVTICWCSENFISQYLLARETSFKSNQFRIIFAVALLGDFRYSVCSDDITRSITWIKLTEILLKGASNTSCLLLWKTFSSPSVKVMVARGKKRTSGLLGLLHTSSYFFVLLRTSSYFSVLLRTSRYFLVLLDTSWYFWYFTWLIYSLRHWCMSTSFYLLTISTRESFRWCNHRTVATDNIDW